MTRKKISGAVIAIVGICLSYYIFAPPLFSSDAEFEAMERIEEDKQKKFIGKPFPHLKTTTLAGKEWSIGQHRGQVVVLDIWATWCPPCVAAIPKIKALQKRYAQRKDFQIIGLSLDNSSQDLNTFLQKQKITWLQLYEDGKSWSNSLATALMAQAIPEIWVIDRQGIVRAIDYDAYETIDLLMSQKR